MRRQRQYSSNSGGLLRRRVRRTTSKTVAWLRQESHRPRGVVERNARWAAEARYTPPLYLQPH